MLMDFIAQLGRSAIARCQSVGRASLMLYGRWYAVRSHAKCSRY
ncbi:hypothetical protein JCM19237_2519 [Photobacterium aphoticum]|uniref:Uncharacterized protein n=1 Tax=Photobacterium aphoticum TaxID=754436 RepID=A0A090QVY3_9GAMM|nr:hypothetical protein JCM19237_2519 [Photobacterium aphoticum]